MKIKKTIALLSLLTLSLGTGACAVGPGTPFPEQNVYAIKKGVTTKDEVVRLFGEPRRTGLEDGEQTWTYFNYKYNLLLLGQEKDNKDLVIRFNDQGVVSSYSYSANKN